MITWAGFAKEFDTKQGKFWVQRSTLYEKFNAASGYEQNKMQSKIAFYWRERATHTSKTNQAIFYLFLSFIIK
jgi:hypothetical protein